MKEFKLTVWNGLTNCEREVIVEIEDEDWDGMSEKEREEYMNEELFSIIEWNWHEITDEETE